MSSRLLVHRHHPLEPPRGEVLGADQQLDRALAALLVKIGEVELEERAPGRRFPLDLGLARPPFLAIEVLAAGQGVDGGGVARVVLLGKRRAEQLVAVP